MAMIIFPNTSFSHLHYGGGCQQTLIENSAFRVISVLHIQLLSGSCKN
jgi:hypothetical protein